jgi:hypothetical protein
MSTDDVLMSTDDVLMSTDDVQARADLARARLCSVLGLQEAAQDRDRRACTQMRALRCMHSDACTQMHALRCTQMPERTCGAGSGPRTCNQARHQGRNHVSSAPVEQDRVHEHAIRHVIRDAITCHQHLWSKIGSTNMQPWKSQPATNDWRKTAR